MPPPHPNTPPAGSVQRRQRGGERPSRCRGAVRLWHTLHSRRCQTGFPPPHLSLRAALSPLSARRGTGLLCRCRTAVGAPSRGAGRVWGAAAPPLPPGVGHSMARPSFPSLVALRVTPNPRCRRGDVPDPWWHEAAEPRHRKLSLWHIRAVPVLLPPPPPPRQPSAPLMLWAPIPLLATIGVTPTPPGTPRVCPERTGGSGCPSPGSAPRRAGCSWLAAARGIVVP